MGCFLGYQPVAGDEAIERIWIDARGSHRVKAHCKDELMTAMRNLRPRPDARLVLLDTEVTALPDGERQRLLSRVGLVPADGGLISSLNAWENISLPVAYHAPRRLPGLFTLVRELLEDLGGIDDNLLGKLPEDMTLYEKRLASYVRALMESPELLVVENPAGGLGPTKRKRTARFAETYQARCPGGTFVQLEEKGEHHE